MSWTRLDDVWTDQPILADLGYDDRWHYLALIQFCSRTQRFDGVVKAVDARRCSDHPDPEKALDNLVAAGLLTKQANTYTLVKIDEHIPPPSVRKNAEQSKVRMQRARKHKRGDHSECLPGNCASAPGAVTHSVTTGVTRNTRTGQDRTGQAPEDSTFLTSTNGFDDDAWLSGVALNDPRDLGVQSTGALPQTQG